MVNTCARVIPLAQPVQVAPVAPVAAVVEAASLAPTLSSFLMRLASLAWSPPSSACFKEKVIQSARFERVSMAILTILQNATAFFVSMMAVEQSAIGWTVPSSLSHACIRPR